MNPDAIASIVNGAIPFFAGLYLTLMSYRIVGKKPGESQQFDAFHAKHSHRMKYLGPLMMIFDVFLAVMGIARAK